MAPSTTDTEGRYIVCKGNTMTAPRDVASNNRFGKTKFFTVPYHLINLPQFNTVSSVPLIGAEVDNPSKTIVV